ncbi:hypothetical protein ADUPG1_011714, partial [Aduncisulcus paluster]
GSLSPSTPSTSSQAYSQVSSPSSSKEFPSIVCLCTSLHWSLAEDGLMKVSPGDDRFVQTKIVPLVSKCVNKCLQCSPRPAQLTIVIDGSDTIILDAFPLFSVSVSAIADIASTSLLDVVRQHRLHPSTSSSSTAMSRCHIVALQSLSLITPTLLSAALSQYIDSSVSFYPTHKGAGASEGVCIGIWTDARCAGIDDDESGLDPSHPHSHPSQTHGDSHLSHATSSSSLQSSSSSSSLISSSSSSSALPTPLPTSSQGQHTIIYTNNILCMDLWCRREGRICIVGVTDSKGDIFEDSSSNSLMYGTSSSFDLSSHSKLSDLDSVLVTVCGDTGDIIDSPLPLDSGRISSRVRRLLSLLRNTQCMQISTTITKEAELGMLIQQQTSTPDVSSLHDSMDTESASSTLREEEGDDGPLVPLPPLHHTLQRLPLHRLPSRRALVSIVCEICSRLYERVSAENAFISECRRIRAESLMGKNREQEVKEDAHQEEDLGQMFDAVSVEARAMKLFESMMREKKHKRRRRKRNKGQTKHGHSSNKKEKNQKNQKNQKKKKINVRRVKKRRRIIKPPSLSSASSASSSA